ncbi:MAG TPA: SRPBCC family protein [Catenuloplanes sp.]|jgi:uncharacterized membrane protein
MSTVQQAIEVGAPVHMVYEEFASFQSYPHFMTGVQEATQVSDNTAHLVMNLDGQRREFDAQLTDCRTDERVAWEAIEGPMLSEVITMRAIDGSRTHIVARLDAEMPTMAPGDVPADEMLNRRLMADLTGFKRYIEGGDPVVSAAMRDVDDAMMGKARFGGPAGAASGGADSPDRLTD